MIEQLLDGSPINIRSNWIAANGFERRVMLFHNIYSYRQTTGYHLSGRFSTRIAVNHAANEGSTDENRKPRHSMAPLTTGRVITMRCARGVQTGTPKADQVGFDESFIDLDSVIGSKLAFLIQSWRRNGLRRAASSQFRSQTRGTQNPKWEG